MRVSDLSKLIERIAEFERVAQGLSMPVEECCGILNVDRATYSALREGTLPPGASIGPDVERRLSYALPLMRRLASNMPGLRPGRVQSPSPPAALAELQAA